MAVEQHEGGDEGQSDEDKIPVVKYLHPHDVGQVAFVAELGEEGPGGAPSAVAGIDGVDQVEHKHEGVDHHIKRFEDDTPDVVRRQFAGQGEEHQQDVEGVGIEDGGGVEPKAAHQQTAYAEALPPLGVKVPELADVHHTAEHVEQIHQQQVVEQAQQRDGVAGGIHGQVRLKLEIDEGLEVGGDELVGHKHCRHSHHGHQPHGHGGEPETVAPFEAVGQPVDDHADNEDDEDRRVVVEDGRDLAPVPLPTDALHHLGGGAPGGLVGLGGVEVGAATEEESREADEEEGEQGVPHGDESAFEPRGTVFATPQQGHHIEQDDGHSHYQEGEVEHAENRNGEPMVEAFHGKVDKDDGDDTGGGGFGFPPFVH